MTGCKTDPGSDQFVLVTNICACRCTFPLSFIDLQSRLVCVSMLRLCIWSLVVVLMVVCFLFISMCYFTVKNRCFSSLHPLCAAHRPQMVVESSTLWLPLSSTYPLQRLTSASLNNRQQMDSLNKRKDKKRGFLSCTFHTSARDTLL